MRRVLDAVVRTASLPVLVLALLVAATAAARDRPVVPPPVIVPPAVADCWDDVRIFDSLSTGPVDFCRNHLRYVPGALDCYRIVDRVCLVVLPVTGEVTDTRSPQLRIPFPCPPGPPPPVCRRLDLR